MRLLFFLTFLFACGLPESEGSFSSDLDNRISFDFGSTSDMGSKLLDMSVVTPPSTRVVQRFYVSEDTVKTFIGMYDTQLKVDCTWREMEDRSIRCTPNTTTMSFAYMNATCTQRVWFSFASICFNIQYALESTTCSGGYRIYAVTPTTKPTQIFIKSGATCFDNTVSYPTSMYSFYQEGAQIPSSTFVQATVQ